ncbi:hypothetical protein Hypma_016066 [Hypsizygus marmoreus]|uniref:Uncharacterized protein n=1 Tax=Hypsizygus marmoreus TaxID=39966 RepID=A0A369KEY2_HYPMA|nr:hypothetical protein Hypma_016066 [Hypsizygus marmoreus]
MPRPRPLTNVASAHASAPEQPALTPRTPHSRSGRAEEGYTEFELQQITDNDEYHDNEMRQHQSVPLLSSSASESFPTPGYRSRGDDFDAGDKRVRGRGDLNAKIVLSRLPLVFGSMLAAFLLVLTVLSWKRPEKLHRYLGISSQVSAPSTSSPASHKNASISDPHLLISYENYTTFPLLPSQYLAECSKLNKGYMSHGKYWEPHKMGVMDVLHADEMDSSFEGQSVCKSTITYMLDGKVGLLADLALLAQAAALARERNRTFLVDDTYWNRGKWTDHFISVRETQPGPEPGCISPPPKELVACPRLARHWVINSRTAKFHFGHGFSDAYEDPYAHNLNRLKPIYKSAWDSLQETIYPNTKSAALIQAARSELAGLTSPDGTGFESYIAIHIRRGDRKPVFYSGSKYIPAEDYVQAGIDTWTRLNPEKSPEDLMIYLASDSPIAYREVLELTEERYTTFSLFRSTDPELRAFASPTEYVQKEFNEKEESERILATRGMIVDFALVSGSWASDEEVAPDATICTISSNVCKLSAVGLGWDRAFGAVDDMGYVDEKRKRWVEIDQKGQIVPVWEPFELF